MSALMSYIPRLITPGRKVFPFDDGANQIIHSLRIRNWSVPGFEVIFKTLGHGEAKSIIVEQVSYHTPVISYWPDEPDAKKEPPILFTLKYDCGGVSEIICREERLAIQSWDSVQYSLYVGPGSHYYPPKVKELNAEYTRIRRSHSPDNNLVHGFHTVVPPEEEARKLFMADSIPVYQNPRITLKYTLDNSWHSKDRLINQPIRGKEYKALPSEPKMFSSKMIYNHFANRIGLILDLINANALPDKLEPLAYYKNEIRIPMTKIAFKPTDFYIAVNESIYKRIKFAKKGNRDVIVPGYRFVTSNAGHKKLLDYATPAALKEANNSFIWCSRLSRPLKDVLAEKCFIPEIFETPCAEDMPINRYGLIKVCPKYANGCFMVDNAAYTEAYEKLIESIAPRKVLTEGELDSIELKRAQTLVPLTEYWGNYEQPILLINRELDFDEVELAGIFAT